MLLMLRHTQTATQQPTHSLWPDCIARARIEFITHSVHQTMHDTFGHNAAQYLWIHCRCRAHRHCMRVSNRWFHTTCDMHATHRNTQMLITFLMELLRCPHIHLCESFDFSILVYDRHRHFASSQATNRFNRNFSWNRHNRL